MSRTELVIIYFKRTSKILESVFILFINLVVVVAVVALSADSFALDHSACVCLVIDNCKNPYFGL
jgi:hypothetical protein